MKTEVKYMVEKNEITGCAAVKRHVKHKKRENPKKAVKKQNTPYKLRIYGVYEV